MKINDLKVQHDEFFYNFVEFLKKLYLHIFQEELSIESELDLEDCNTNFDKEILDIFALNYPKLKEQLKKDLAFYLESDPAIHSKEEVILTYPGLKGIYLYRIAHLLDDGKVAILPRFISEYAHSKTGIDINPSATIGCPFFIDHGTGIVIGETVIIGDFVKIYHGVTLGASNLSNCLSLKKQKRHPTVGSNVTIYANATILGGNTCIGNHSIIGSNLMITNSIDEDTLVYLKNNEVIQKHIQ